MVPRAAHPSVGDHLGALTLLARIGGGLDTSVWRAELDGVGVAVKLLRDPDDQFARARLAREVAVAARARHPALLPVVAAGDSHVVFPLLECGTLSQLVDDGRVSAGVVAAIGARIAGALAALHAVGVVHRDVSPRNVLLGPDGPVLIDLGAAAIDGVTLDGTIDGAAARIATPRYAPPEASVGPSADVYSLAAVLAEALTGSPTPDAESLHAFGPLGSLLVRCLASSPQARPSASEAEAVLRPLVGASVAPWVAPPLVLDDDAEPFRTVAAQGADSSDEADGGVTGPDGRGLELARLLDDLDAAAATAEFRSVLCVGDAGIGKSWLLRTAVERARRDGHEVFTAVCTEAIGDLRVLAPWMERLTSRVTAHQRRVLERAVGRAHGSGAVGPAEIADALAAGFAAAGPAVAVLDDLHHADVDLLDVLARVAFRTGVRGALWCAARPGVVDADDLGAHTLVVGPLPDDVIARIAGTGTVAVAAGNPLVAEELARRWDHGLDGALALDDLLAARVDALDDVSRDDLVIAAACGEVFWPEALGLAGSLDTLHRSGVVRSNLHSEVPGSTEVAFSHPRLREVVYAGLVETQRHAAHVVVARRLDDGGADVELVAHHLAAAGPAAPGALVERVAPRAGWAALDRFSVAAARRWAQLLHDRPRDGAETAAIGSDAPAAVLAASLAVVDGDPEVAVRLAGPHRGVDGETGERATLVCAEAHFALGQLAECVAVARNGAARVVDDGRRDELAVLHARALHRLDQFDGAAEVARASAFAAAERGATASAARLWAVEAIAVSELAMRTGDDSHDSTRLAQRALHLLEVEGDDRAHAEAACELVEVLSAVDPGTADAVVGPALAAAQRAGARSLDAALATTAAHLALDHGDLDRLHTMVARARAGTLDDVRRSECDALEHVAALAGSGPDDGRLTALAAAASAPGPVDPTITIASVVVPTWFGRTHVGRGAGEIAVDYPHIARMVDCHARAIDGVDWSEPDVGDLRVVVANELALLAYLRGDRERGDTLLVERHAHLAATGSTYQRFNHLYPGALVAALGPAVTAPRVEWLVDEIIAAPLPAMWALHRVMCSIVLIERAHPDAQRLRTAARELIDVAQPPVGVAAWMRERLESAPADAGP